MKTSNEELEDYFGGGPDFFMLEEAFKKMQQADVDFNEESLDSSRIQTDQILNTIQDNLLVTQEKNMQFRDDVSIRQSLLS